MKAILDYLKKNSVFVTGLLSALLLVIQQALTNHSTDWKALGFAALVAVLGYIGNALKGKGWSIAGVIGTVSYAFVAIWTTGSFSWKEFILSASAAILGIAIKAIQPEPPVPPQP